MAASTSSSLSALLKKSTLDDHEQILAACNKVLKATRSDLEAQHVKVVALLKLDRYDEAITFIEAAGDGLRTTAALEYAYALYKTGRLEEAAELASEIRERGAQHIEAQSRYRLEEPSKTTELYKRIRSEGSESEEYDLRVNQGAIDAQAQWLGAVDPKNVRRPERQDLDAFETAYNAACGSIARGEYAQAEVLLKRAKELCKHSDDLPDQQKAEELLPISVQQLYVLLCLGKTTEAKTIAGDIKIDDASDMSTRKVGQTNVLLISALSNPFLAHKTFHTSPKVPPEDKLFSYQSIPVESNKATLDLQTFKFEGIISSTSKAIKAQSSPSTSPAALLASYINAAAHAQNEMGKTAIRRILPELKKRPNDIGIILTLVQLYMSCGDATSAVELVETFFQRLESSKDENDPSIRFNPVLVSLLTSLYKQRGQKPRVQQELEKAASYWRPRSNPPTNLLTAAGTSLLESRNEIEMESAANIFSKLREQQPRDKATLAGFVASHAKKDEIDVKSDAEQLTPTTDLTRNIDVDALEAAGIPQSSNALTIAQLGRTRKRGAPDGGNARPKRLRRSRLPKDYDENKKPDAERWLPMKDRSYYRPPKGRKKVKRGGETQGGAVNEDLNVDAKPATPVATASGGNKKKKGKGKK